MRVIKPSQIYQENGVLKISLIEGQHNMNENTPVTNKITGYNTTIKNAIIVELGSTIYLFPKTAIADYVRGGKVIKDVPKEYLIEQWMVYNSPYNAQMDNTVRIDRQFEESSADSKLVAKIKDFINMNRLDVDPANLVYVQQILTEISNGRLSEKKAQKFLNYFGADYDVAIFIKQRLL